MKKFPCFLLAILAAGSFACRQNTGGQAAPAIEKAATPPPSGPVFQPSSRSPVSGGAVSTNWCLGKFAESVVINAEREKTNRRYFYLGEGITKVNVAGGGGVSAFFLHPAGANVVELLTGAHFPECLSMPDNFTLAADGRSFRYQSLKDLHFTAEVGESEGHLRVTIEIPEGAGFGMNADRCSNCQ